MKRSNKKLIALLSVCCLATAGLALAGCTGEVGPKGPAGKSAYEIAVENGFEGTEAEWLESLKGDKGDKGDPAVDHEHAYGEVITLLDPTIYKDGLGYKACTEDGCDHIETVIVGIPEVVEGEENVFAVPTEGAVLVKIPSVSKSGSVAVRVWDENGEELSADDWEFSYELYASYGDSSEVHWVNSDAYYSTGDTAILSISASDTSSITVAVYVLDGTEQYDYVVSVVGTDGAPVSATKVQAKQDGEVVAEADVVDGKATLSLLYDDYDLEVVGLADGYSAQATSISASMGGEYTILALKSYAYTVTVKNGETLLDNATVKVLKAQGVQGETPEFYENESFVEATAETVDGVATFTIPEAQYYNYVTDEYEYGFYYRVSFVYDGLTDKEQPCAPVELKPLTDDCAVVLTVEEKPLPVWEVGKGVVDVAAGSKSAEGKITLTAEEAGDYLFTFTGGSTAFPFLANMNLTIKNSAGETSVVVNQSAGFTPTVALAEGENSISIKPKSGNLMPFTLDIEKVAGSGGGEEAEANTITLDGNKQAKVTNDKEYTYKVEEAGIYKITIVSSTRDGENAVADTMMFHSEADGTSMNYLGNIWLDGNSSTSVTETTAWEVDQEVVFYFRDYGDGVLDITIQIEKVENGAK